MNNKYSDYFTENISDEKLAELIDEMLKFEKIQKSKNLKSILSSPISS